MQTSWRSRSRVVAVALTAVLAGVAGCASTSPEPAATPTHAHGAPAGDGLVSEAHGVRLTGVSLPERAGKPGTVSLEILDASGSPVTSLVRDQTKLLHLYVVRSDLTAFRHLHPEYRRGTWRVPTTLPSPGSYRVITEFSLKDAGHTDHLILGTAAEVAGPRPAKTPAPLAASDGTVKVAIDGAEDVSTTGRLHVRVADRHGRPVKLGAYLGTTGHITGFHRVTGQMVHLHPVGVPAVEADATVLTLHTGEVPAGPYVFFVQVRADGFLHTLRAGAQLS